MSPRKTKLRKYKMNALQHVLYRLKLGVIYLISWIIAHIIVVGWVMFFYETYKSATQVAIKGLSWMHANVLMPLITALFGPGLAKLYGSAMHGNYHAETVIYPVLIGVIALAIIWMVNLRR